MRIVVTGGRDYTDRAALFLALDLLHAATRITRLAHGNARGADTLADDWARVRRVELQRYPADWDRHRKRAGAIRNRAMLDAERPDVVVAFPGGRGTADCVRAAGERGIPVLDLRTGLRAA